MKIKIFAFDDFTGDVQRSCFRENLEFTGFMNYEGIDNLSEEDKKSCFFIVENEGLVHLFHEHGISDKNVIPLFGKKAILDLPRRLKMLSLWRWIYEYFRYFTLKRISEPICIKFPKLGSFLKNYSAIHNIKKDLSFINKYHQDKRKIVFFGLNEVTKLYIDHIELTCPELLYGIIFYSEEHEKLETKYEHYTKTLDELFYENLDDFLFYVMNDWEYRKIEGMLIENGVKKSNIFRKGRRKEYLDGTLKIEAYDPILGYSRIGGEVPSFAVFSNADDQQNTDIFKIITLGGSTTDPYFSNIKSWSEYLFEMLKNLNIPVKIYAGGVAAYTVSQEALKLIKDGLNLKPDLVFSYSGMNDVPNLYNVDNYFFIKRYMLKIFTPLIQKKMIKNEMQCKLLRITELALGVKGLETDADFWIKCEKIMHAVCNEFGIEFHAFLQPTIRQEAERIVFFDAISTYIARGGGGQILVT